VVTAKGRTMALVALAAFSAACGGSELPAAAAVSSGSATTDGGLTMTVTDTFLDITGGDTYSWGIYVAVKLHVVNTTEDIALFAPMLQDLHINGHLYSPNATAAEAVDAETSSAAVLAPHSGADVALAFPVFDEGNPPLKNKTVKLALYGNRDSPGVVVDLPNSHLRVINQ
jgi:hypothetical protein